MAARIKRLELSLGSDQRYAVRFWDGLLHVLCCAARVLDETTSRVLGALARRHPLRLEVIRQRQVTHAESLAMKRRAHIVIDECVTGSYHRNSLEGLAAFC